MKLLIMQSSPVSCHFLPHALNAHTRHSELKRLYLIHSGSKIFINQDIKQLSRKE
jgi:hypothetical protein